jgi:tetratricopeptide (TPR) repeat protein
LELHAISQKISEGVGRFEITMPSVSRDSFLQATHSCYDNYFMLLTNVGAEYSVCSREKDREDIHQAIKDSIGFDGLNRSIYSVFSHWIINQIKLHIRELKSDPQTAARRMKDLGVILKQLGRYREALLALQDALQVFVKFGSVAPASCGTRDHSDDAYTSRQIVRIYALLGQYHLAQSHHDSMCARQMSTLDHASVLQNDGKSMVELCAEFDREKMRLSRILQPIQS